VKKRVFGWKGFCLFVGMFLDLVQGEHCQMRRSEDFLEEQATRFIGEE
jgi:hypothetical protein